MSAKNQSALKRKQAKQVKRQKAIKKQVHAAEQRGHAQKRAHKTMQDTRMRYSIATEGVIKTAAALRKEGYNGKTAQKLNNVGVLRGIHDMIPVFATLHGATEVVHNLVMEKRFELTTEQVDLMANFDRTIVRITEDVNAIYDFIDAGKKPTDYMELYVHYIDALAEVCEIQMPLLMETLFRPNQVHVDQYIMEHAGPTHTMESYSMEMHGIRMERVAPLYRTKSTETEDMTAPLASPTGDLVDEDDVDADVAVEMAKEIPSNPLTC